MNVFVFSDDFAGFCCLFCEEADVTAEDGEKFVRLADVHKPQAELVQLLERAKVYARGPFLDEINACLEKQPTQVSVVLPERCDNKLVSTHYRNGWNACLDKIKELNQ